MKTPEELLSEFAASPAKLAEYAAHLQEELAQAERERDLKERQLAEAERERDLTEQQLAEARAIIAELKRELFGAKADKLNPEQEAQLQQLIGDAQEQSQRPPPVSRKCPRDRAAQI